MLQDLLIAGGVLAGTFAAGYMSAAVVVWFYRNR